LKCPLQNAGTMHISAALRSIPSRPRRLRSVLPAASTGWRWIPMCSSPAFVEDSVQEGAVLMLPHVHNYKLSALIRGIYSNLGPSFQYFGAGTVSQFTEAGYTDEGVALALVEEAYFTQGVGHGWMPLGEPMLITRAERNRIYELDGQPAVQRYCAVVREMLDQEIDITGHKFQLGIPCGSGIM